DRDLTLVPGDRLVLRYPGARVVVGGARVLDVDPPALTRRGDGAREVLNRNAGMTESDYYDRTRYQEMFAAIFERLRAEK
ncbi:hypothetical protein GUG69_04775, partial [Xanthomonas citri pv. citri]|nr:hypothetical protein [Xanthomonas citri pv. citri]